MWTDVLLGPEGPASRWAALRCESLSRSSEMKTPSCSGATPLVTFYICANVLQTFSSSSSVWESACSLRIRLDLDLDAALCWLSLSSSCSDCTSSCFVIRILQDHKLKLVLRTKESGSRMSPHISDRCYNQQPHVQPAVSHDNHPQLVSQVLHLMNLNKGSCRVDVLQGVSHIWLIAARSRNIHQRVDRWQLLRGFGWITMIKRWLQSMLGLTALCWAETTTEDEEVICETYLSSFFRKTPAYGWAKRTFLLNSSIRSLFFTWQKHILLQVSCT